MGEVYRAVDTSLGRDVALKLLPAELASDAQRLARLDREAKLLAQLNHPNIAAIHGFEQSDGKRFLVLELVEGEDLSERIARGALPVDEAIEIAKQIASALEAAHLKGIVHRDLKPANVKLASDGNVKVLDFGLAKAWSDEPRLSSGPDLSRSPTLAYTGTQAGVILGTVAYMSPEQARGKPVDRSADIWALGVVLWEMLTGRPMFTGETVSDVIAAVLTRELNWSALPPSAARCRGVLERCLERDPKRRMRDAGDVRLELERAEARPAEEAPSVVASPAARRALSLPVLASLLVCGALVGAVAARLLWRPASPQVPSRTLSIPLLPTQELSIADNANLAFSPDGSSVVFCGSEQGKRRIFRRRLSSPDVVAIEGTDSGSAPFFSPDGAWLGFTAGGFLKKVPADGGRPFELANQQGAGGAAWLPGGDVVYAPLYSDGLFRVSAEGGATKRLTTPDRAHGELGHWWPQPLPDGKSVLFTGFRTPVDTSRIAVVSLETGAVRDVVQGGFMGRYVRSGHVLYAKGQRLFAVPFDAARGVVTGPAKAVLDDVFTSQTGGFALFDVSSDGVLAYVPRSVADAPRELIWVEADGHVQQVIPDTRRYRDVSISPDGRNVAVTIQGDSLDVWTVALDRGTLSRLTSGPGTEYGALWTPSGRDLLFIFDRPPFEIHTIPFGSSAEERPLWKEKTELDTAPGGISPDGRLVAYTLTEPETGLNIWVRPLDGSEPARPFRATRAEEVAATFSPDGAFLAYQSDETGRSEVYVEAFPGPGDRHQVSADGGTEPLWARNGELFYRHNDEMRVVTTRTKPTFALGEQRTRHRMSPYLGAHNARSYDVTADGKRVITIRTLESSAPRRVDVVTGWTDELRRVLSAR